MQEPRPEQIAAALGGQTVSLDLASVGTTLQPGVTYHYRVIAANEGSPTVEGPDQIFTTPSAGVAGAAPSEVVTEPAEVIPGGASLKGELNPDGLPTTYYFEYVGDNEVGCLDVENCWHQTTNMGPVTGDTQQQIPPIELTGLGSEETYRYRLVASNARGTVTGNVASFTTPSFGVSAPATDGRRWWWSARYAHDGRHDHDGRHEPVRDRAPRLGREAPRPRPHRRPACSLLGSGSGRRPSSSR